MASKTPKLDSCRALELSVMRDMSVRNAGRLQTTLEALQRLQSLKLKPRPHLIIGSHVQGFYLTQDVRTIYTCIQRILFTRKAEDIQLMRAVLENHDAVLVQSDRRVWELKLDIGIVRITL